MTLVRWDPFRDLVSRTEDSFGAWAPAVDIFEKDQNLVIRAEMPGLNREDIEVGMENGVLTLKGERKREAEFNEGDAYRLERVYGTFTRSFSLPTTVDPAKIEAVYKDGVLEVTVPKLEAAKPKKVQIQAA